MNRVARKVFLYKVAKQLDDAGRLLGSPAVVLAKENKAAVIRFNRPRFFNCIDESVIGPAAAFLSNIVTESSADVLVIEGSNNRGKNYAFTTGGDLLMGRNIIERKEKTNTITEKERLYLVNIYRTQHYLHKLGKEISVISLMDGASMGSGVLFGLNSTFSVATERTVWAIPEVIIGGMPDVGVIFHMNNLENNLGTMMALTGMRMTGTELVMAGIASHFCSSDKVSSLKKELMKVGGQGRRINDVKDILDKYHQDSVDQEDIKRKKEKIQMIKDFTGSFYSSENLLDILENLKLSNKDLSRQQLHLLGKGCPLSQR